ncbi:MAG: TIGR04295 family B12-binding domain-containing radical SAM protein [Acidobacteria bacterium]|nr:TIGR04295 family B12-binding domain-containing radical SAM protein [Acidobacteriota bacterium]MBA3885762.1 TIGR04295 family B12-binding domain-containing radical SAM protein [Acidobacteriota bacterium]
MKFALLNPRWTFDGGIYFGCREPHLPLEYGYARALLERDGHEVLLVDAQLHDLPLEEVAGRVSAFAPDRLVITTAPSYLFWRCAPPELRVPQETLRALAGVPGLRIVVGPHASTTPAATLRKLGADVAVLGECEDILPKLASRQSDWPAINSIACAMGGEVRVQGEPHQCDLSALPALHWPAADVGRHHHHHHRFDAEPLAPGAEMELSRGCPYHCTFCAKDNFRDDYRKRPLPVILEEVDGFVAQGVEYIYFIDEIFLPNTPLLEALVERPVRFGLQTRIDLWTPAMLDLLGQAGCVSIEAGVESITVEGRNLLDKASRLTTEQLADRLIHAKRSVPFVQANLLESGADDPADVEAWRRHLQQFGVWANKPVPMFPYPGSPGYTRRWGAPDDRAWERAIDFYLGQFQAFSDIQEARPRPLSELELHNADTH